MLTVPLLVGVVVGGPAWVHVPLAVAWYVAYFAFFAAGLWLRSGRKARYFPPVRVYALVAVVPGLVVCVVRPEVLWWALVFGPLVVGSAVCSHYRADRSLLNDVLTVVAATLMLPVAWSLGSTPGHEVAMWQSTAMVGAYFVGTVLYVKTMIRERGSRMYYVASVVYHLMLVVVPFVWAQSERGLVHEGGAAIFAAFFTLLAARAVIMPQVGGTPRQVGMGRSVRRWCWLFFCLVRGEAGGNLAWHNE